MDWRGSGGAIYWVRVSLAKEEYRGKMLVISQFPNAGIDAPQLFGLAVVQVETSGR